MKRQIKNGIRRLAAATWACMMTVALMVSETPVEAYGAESSVIESVSVTFKTSFGDTEEVPEPVVTVSGTGCSLGGVEYQKAQDKWKPGSKVRITVTVEAAAGKVFPTSLNKTKCKVKGAEFVSAKATKDNKLLVKVDYKPITVLGNTSKAGWSGTVKNRAVWNPVDYAPGYTVILYGDNKTVKKLNVTTNYADLDAFMKDDGKVYYYEVKAVPITSEDKKCFKEGILISSSENDIVLEGTTSSNTPSGTQATGGSAGGWKKEDDQWYYYGQDGKLMKGWQNIGGAWYYLSQNGRMQTGWVVPPEGGWYYAADNGMIQTGWVQPEPGAWYYMDGSGRMQIGWVQVNGTWYYMAQNGRMQTGWVQVGGLWYYLYPDGSMAANTVIDGWTLGPSGAAQ